MLKLGREALISGNRCPAIPKNFCGILASINVVLKEGTTPEQVQAAFEQAYQDEPIVRLLKGTYPAIKNVESTPFCDIAWAQDGEDLVVFSATDNLLKGASSQAMQCINIKFGFPMTTSLV